MKISIQKGLGEKDTSLHCHHPPSSLPDSSLVLFLSPLPWLLGETKQEKLDLKLVRHTLGICNSQKEKKKEKKKTATKGCVWRVVGNMSK